MGRFRPETTEQVLAAVRSAPGRTELHEFPVPEIPDDGALLKVEVAGICGTDVKMYTKPAIAAPVSTAGAGVTPVLLGIDALERRAGTLLAQGELAAFPDFPLKKLTENAITMKSARGHSYRAVALALEQLASRRSPPERLTTHDCALHDVDRGIRAVGGEVEGGVIHVSLPAWKDGPR